MLNGFMHIKATLGKQGVFRKFKIQAMLAGFAAGRRLDTHRRKHGCASWGISSFMPPPAEARGFLRWSTMVGLTDAGLAELNSALICVP